VFSPKYAFARMRTLRIEKKEAAGLSCDTLRMQLN
jgi:hypothetical protein